MPTFTETHTLQSIEIFPSLKTIRAKWLDTTLKDGVKIQESISCKNYSNADTANFAIEVAPTGKSLEAIVAGFSEAAIQQRDEAVATVKTITDARSLIEIANAATAEHEDAKAASEQAKEAADKAKAAADAAVAASEAAKQAAEAQAAADKAAYDLLHPGVLTTVTMRQARLALLGAGLLDTVNAGMAGMSQAAQIEWEFASEVQRSNPLIGAMGAALGMTDAQLDDLFTLGSTL